MMKVRLGKKIVADVEYSDELDRISRGLRFSKKLGKSEGLLLKVPCETRLHALVDMMFVFFSVDIIWLDSRKKIVDIKRNARPFTIHMPKARSLYVLEMNANSTGNLKMGDRLSFR